MARCLSSAVGIRQRWAHDSGGHTTAVATGTTERKLRKQHNGKKTKPPGKANGSWRPKVSLHKAAGSRQSKARPIALTIKLVCKGQQLGPSMVAKLGKPLQGLQAVRSQKDEVLLNNSQSIDNNHSFDGDKAAIVAAEIAVTAEGADDDTSIIDGGASPDQQGETTRFGTTVPKSVLQSDSTCANEHDMDDLDHNF